MDGSHWLSALAAGLLVFTLVELEKAVLRQRPGKKSGVESSGRPARHGERM
jgi:hypothetical protein